MDHISEKLNLDDLFKQSEVENNVKENTYKKILNRVHTKIKYVSRIKNNKQFCMFVIPEFILGMPLYNHSACTAYILEKLKKNGFKVKYTYPNLLFIYWGHYIPKFKRKQYKKQTGTQIDGFGNIVKKKDKYNNNNMNSLFINKNLKKKENLQIVKKEKKANRFNDINSYKPSGNFIYSSEMVKKLHDVSSKDDDGR